MIRPWCRSPRRRPAAPRGEHALTAHRITEHGHAARPPPARAPVPRPGPPSSPPKPSAPGSPSRPAMTSYPLPRVTLPIRTRHPDSGHDATAIMMGNTMDSVLRGWVIGHLRGQGSAATGSSSNADAPWPTPISPVSPGRGTTAAPAQQNTPPWPTAKGHSADCGLAERTSPFALARGPRGAFACGTDGPTAENGDQPARRLRSGRLDWPTARPLVQGGCDGKDVPTLGCLMPRAGEVWWWRDQH